MLKLKLCVGIITPSPLYHCNVLALCLSAKHHTNIDTWQNFHMFLIHSLNCGSALYGQDDNALSKWRFTHLPIQYAIWNYGAENTDDHFWCRASSIGKEIGNTCIPKWLYLYYRCRCILFNLQLAFLLTCLMVTVSLSSTLNTFLDILVIFGLLFYWIITFHKILVYPKRKPNFTIDKIRS